MPLLDRILTLLRRLRLPGATVPLLNSEPAHRLLVAHSRSFRDLLVAFACARKAMAELETAWEDGRPLSMSFIRARCTQVTVNVFKVIRHQGQIADRRDSELERAFSRLRQRIEAILEGERQPVAGEMLLDLAQINRTLTSLTGEKMASLAEAGAITNIRIPPGFVLTAAATDLFFQRNQLYRKINHILQQTEVDELSDLYSKSASIQELIQTAPMAPELETLLLDRFDRLTGAGPACRVAVRSSAIGEEFDRSFFTGLYHTELDVGRDRLIDACKTVLASKYTPQAISYRLAKGLLHERCAMGIGVLAMVEAAVSGICHTCSIDGPGDTLDLFYAPGMAKGIVESTRSVGHLRLSRLPPHRIVRRQEAEDATRPWLTDVEAIALAEAGMRLEHHFGAPREIEWSIDRTGSLFVLQSRPAAVPRASVAPSPPVVAGQPLLHGGVTGCDGAGYGEVFVVRTMQEALHCPRRAVLVVRHPLPSLAPLLHRAVALVAETGNQACHLAAQAREFGLPCLMAMERATELLAAGTPVTVDATGRAVYQGRVEPLLRPTVDRPDPMAGSPVQRTLASALALISPLTLLDPCPADFRTVHCQTLHDIMRLCHGQAVRRMFEFSLRSGQGKAAKRLRSTLPGQWWAIDLDEAPGDDDHRPDIELTDIASPLPHALWGGMQHVSGQKPAFSRRQTAAAALIRAGVRRGFDLIRAPFSREKNYFLISQKYCNLSIQLDRQPVMVEAMFDDQRGAGSITFRAAGSPRQTWRLELLAQLLDHFGYRINRVGGALFAWMDQESDVELFDRLKTLGYLAIRIRGLDAERADAGGLWLCRDKIICEIKEMLHHD